MVIKYKQQDNPSAAVEKSASVVVCMQLAEILNSVSRKRFCSALSHLVSHLKYSLSVPLDPFNIDSPSPPPRTASIQPIPDLPPVYRVALSNQPMAPQKQRATQVQYDRLAKWLDSIPLSHGCPSTLLDGPDVDKGPQLLPSSQRAERSPLNWLAL